MAGPSHEVTISVTEAVPESFDSALELASAFGSPVFEPAWWPAEVGAISYLLFRFPDVDRGVSDDYHIGSTRHGDVPIYVVGHREHPDAERAGGEWYAAPELATVRGLIGRVGVPPRLQAVVHHDKLAIHLIGYQTDDEIIGAATSLRRISAG